MLVNQSPSIDSSKDLALFLEELKAKRKKKLEQDICSILSNIKSNKEGNNNGK